MNGGRMPNTTHHRFPSNDRIKTRVPHPRVPVSHHQASSHLRPNNLVPRRDCLHTSPRSLRRAPLTLRNNMDKGIFMRQLRAEL